MAKLTNTHLQEKAEQFVAHLIRLSPIKIIALLVLAKFALANFANFV